MVEWELIKPLQRAWGQRRVATRWHHQRLVVVLPCS
jgi:hypothetical protein